MREWGTGEWGGRAGEENLLAEGRQVGVISSEITAGQNMNVQLTKLNKISRLKFKPMTRGHT